MKNQLNNGKRREKKKAAKKETTASKARDGLAANENEKYRLDLKGKTNAAREQQERRRRRRRLKLDSRFTYLIMSNAAVGFDGLDDATSRATATASTEPRIKSAFSCFSSAPVFQSRATRPPRSHLGDSLYRSSICAGGAEERSHGEEGSCEI
jgi:hypothetical protein